MQRTSQSGYHSSFFTDHGPNIFTFPLIWTAIVAKTKRQLNCRGKATDSSHTEEETTWLLMFLCWWRQCKPICNEEKKPEPDLVHPLCCLNSLLQDKLCKNNWLHEGKIIWGLGTTVIVSLAGNTYLGLLALFTLKKGRKETSWSPAQTSHLPSATSTKLWDWYKKILLFFFLLSSAVLQGLSYVNVWVMVSFHINNSYWHVIRCCNVWKKHCAFFFLLWYFPVFTAMTVYDLNRMHFNYALVEKDLIFFFYSYYF